jgi:hypothetical protein
MKKMKTLALLFLAVIISSTGLTSCIDEDVSPAVAAIYQNQALLLSSQANLNDAQATYQIALANLQDAYAAAALSAAADASQATDAQATYQLALANLQDARAAAVLSAAGDASLLAQAASAYQLALANLEDARAAALLSAAADASAESAQNVLSQAAMTAISVAAATQDLSEAEEALLQTIAENAIALETALANLELAKLGWEIQMIALQASIDDAFVVLASDYFDDYQSAKNSAIIQEGLAIMKQSEIDVAQLLLETAGDVTWEFYLAQQEDILTGLQADLVAKEAAAAALASVIADPSTAASTSSDFQAMILENEGTIDALDAEIAALDGDLLPIFEELDKFYDLNNDYYDTLDDIGFYEGDVASWENDVDFLEFYIGYLEASILSYDDDLAAAEAVVADAEDDLDAAEVAQDAALVANDLAYDDYTVASLAFNDALSETILRQDEWDAQETAVNDAAAALVAAENTALANDGAAAELVTLNAEIADQGLAVVEYNFARSLFEADPTGATYVEGEHNGVDGVLGNHTDILVDSYMQISTVNVDPPLVAADVTFTGSLISDGSGLPVFGFEAALWGALDSANDNGLYFDVELDDVMPMSNEARFAAATTAKLDADDDLETAQGVYDDALDAESTVAQDLIDAQDAYDAQVVIFEDNGAAIVLAQGVQDAAQIVSDDAWVVYMTANTLYGTANLAVSDAEGDVDDAEDDVDDLLNYTPAVMQADLEIYAHYLLESSVMLAEMQAVLDATLAAFAIIEADLEEVLLIRDDTVAAYFAIINEMDDVYEEMDALYMMNDQMQLVVDAISMDNDDLQGTLDGILTDITTCYDAIEAQEVVIAVGSIDEAAAQAAITQLEAELANIESQIDGYNTLAAKYWDLMQAALAG